MHSKNLGLRWPIDFASKSSWKTQKVEEPFNSGWLDVTSRSVLSAFNTND